VTEYKHQQVGIGFPVYCTDRDASAVEMLMWAAEQDRQYMMLKRAFLMSPYNNPLPRRRVFATDPAELRWMADIAAGDDVWGA
jgi:hypothetical protein